MRAYAWLGVSLAALVDVDEGYKVAYGGEQRFGGIDVQNEERKSPSPLALKTSFAPSDFRKMKLSISYSTTSTSTSTSSNSESTSPRTSSCSSSSSSAGSDDEAPVSLVSVHVGESAKGTDLRVEQGLREDRGPHRRGAVTPNGFEDITPVTKGEWCFLMVGDRWKEARTVPVTTC